MEIKYYEKRGLISWSNSKNHSELLANAALDVDANGLYNLDILSLDLQERGKKINVVGSAYTDNAFRCIAWDVFGEKDSTLLELFRFFTIWFDFWRNGKWILLTLEPILNDCSLSFL